MSLQNRVKCEASINAEGQVVVGPALPGFEEFQTIGTTTPFFLEAASGAWATGNLTHIFNEVTSLQPITSQIWATSPAWDAEIVSWPVSGLTLSVVADKLALVACPNDGSTNWAPDAIPGALAVGAASEAWEQTSIAVGIFSRSHSYGSITIGNSNLASGVTSAMHAGAEYIGTGQIVVGNGTTVEAVGGVAIGDAATITGGGGAGVYGVALGSQATVAGGHGIAIGYLSSAPGEGALAVGERAACSGLQAVSLGSQATASGQFTTVLGSYAAGSATRTTAIGHNANATADNATATGTSAKAFGAYSAAYGAWTDASGDRSTALGGFSRALGEKSTAVGGGAVTHFGEIGIGDPWHGGISVLPFLWAGDSTATPATERENPVALKTLKLHHELYEEAELVKVVGTYVAGPTPNVNADQTFGKFEYMIKVIGDANGVTSHTVIAAPALTVLAAGTGTVVVEVGIGVDGGPTFRNTAGGAAWVSGALEMTHIPMVY